tara:strand:+ start:981 stop:1529 length:549 start_codon:yes stop_codon:yes gene_type:complete
MNNINLPLWRQKLKASQSKEGKLSSNRWIQIANVSQNNQPRVRTVVFRGWIDSTTMLIYTDKRTEKFKDLKLNNNIEVLWLFYKSQSQYRFKGNAYEVENDAKYWDNLSEKTKMPWFWPSPGEKLDPVKDFLSIKDCVSKPNNFSVLKIIINEVDLLKLENPVHKRYIWKEKDNWECMEVYP